MRVYLLDWNGTLNTLEDPLGYVQALQARGYKACLYSGGSLGHDQALFNQVAYACDDVVRKSKGFHEVEEQLTDMWGSDLEYIYAEDDVRYLAYVEDLVPHWRIVEPCNLLRELEN